MEHMVFEKQIAILQDNLQKHSDAKTKAWWENYVKESAPYLGVKMSLVRSELHQWHHEHVEGRLALPEQRELALALFEGTYTEEKLAGTLYLQEILLPKGALDCGREIIALKPVRQRCPRVCRCAGGLTHKTKTTGTADAGHCKKGL